jgi:hypothetical protein
VALPKPLGLPWGLSLALVLLYPVLVMMVAGVLLAGLAGQDHQQRSANERRRARGMGNVLVVFGVMLIGATAIPFTLAGCLGLGLKRRAGPPSSRLGPAALLLSMAVWGAGFTIGGALAWAVFVLDQQRGNWGSVPLAMLVGAIEGLPMGLLVGAARPAHS